MTKDEVIALVRAIGGSDRADPVCAQGDMITLDVDEVVRLVNIAAAQQAEQATQLNQSLGLYEQASEPVALSWDVQMPDDVAKWITAHPPKLHPPRPVVRLTDKEISNIVDEVDHRYGGGGEWAERFARAVESAVLKKMGVVG